MLRKPCFKWTNLILKNRNRSLVNDNSAPLNRPIKLMQMIRRARGDDDARTGRDVGADAGPVAQIRRGLHVIGLRGLTAIEAERELPVGDDRRKRKGREQIAQARRTGSAAKQGPHPKTLL